MLQLSEGKTGTSIAVKTSIRARATFHITATYMYAWCRAFARVMVTWWSEKHVQLDEWHNGNTVNLLKQPSMIGISMNIVAESDEALVATCRITSLRGTLSAVSPLSWVK